MQERIGSYTLIRSLGKGGMGEVFLSHDPICLREVALKLIRPEWSADKTMRERFLKEARIAAHLSHPSIIPIYSIHQDQDGIYYTMPCIEGETLKAIIRTTKQSKGAHPIGSSIPTLMRIFLSVCGAIAYAHSRGILHRDLKPENIIVGTYGEVIILDWGLADFIGEDRPLNVEGGSNTLTKPGAIPGTLSYMEPERALGEPSAPSTDIYALGVILYQLLTLHLPFQRTTLKEFRKKWMQEELPDPQESAPERDISPQLADIVRKCLSPRKEERYKSVSELIEALESYIEGIPDWFETTTLHLDQKSDWGIQENIALAKHMAITRQHPLLEWVSLMISKRSFPGNIKLETEVELGEEGQGLGLLISQPANAARHPLEEGYLLWLGPPSTGSRLFRSGVEVMHSPESVLNRGQRTQLTLEKIGPHLRLFINGTCTLNFLSHTPLTGSHVGMLLRDGDVAVSPLKVYLGSQQAMINCLAIPDAFASRKLYPDALLEYRKVAHSFPGRAEGREALFRAGLMLLEEARPKSGKERAQLLSAALDEFEKLHSTPGAPLEYLGKSLVYLASDEIDEEVKCLELALRKFPLHPLKPILVEQIASRLHKSAQSDRKAAFQFALLTLRHLPELLKNSDHEELISSLRSYLEPLGFLQPSSEPYTDMAIQLAFWLGKPLVLIEMIEKGLTPVDARNALFALLQMGERELVENLLTRYAENGWREELYAVLGDRPTTLPSLVHLFAIYLRQGKNPLPLFTGSAEAPALHAWAHLLHGELEEAGKILAAAPEELKKNEANPLFFVQTCALIARGKKAEAETLLLNITESTYPPIWSLLAHYLGGHITLKGIWWTRRAFVWEKILLCLQLQLYFHCMGAHKRKAALFRLQKRLSS